MLNCKSVLFRSVPSHVEMDKEIASWNVVEDKANVTIEPSHKPQQAVMLVPVLCGKLEIGVR